MSIPKGLRPSEDVVWVEPRDAELRWRPPQEGADEQQRVELVRSQVARSREVSSSCCKTGVDLEA